MVTLAKHNKEVYGGADLVFGLYWAGFQYLEGSDEPSKQLWRYGT